LTESPRLACLGFDWSVRADDTALVRYITSLYEPCLAPGRANHTFVLASATEAPPRLHLTRDGCRVLSSASPSLAVAQLVWEVNRGVVEETTNRLLLHAAAAEQDGAVVVIAGPRGSGKSTMVAALVRAGFRYLTDETVAVDPVSTTIEPCAKPIALGPGSWPLLPDLRPEVAPTGDAAPEWLLAPRSIRADAVAPAGGIAALVLLLSRRPGAPTTAHPITRAEAVVALAEQSFNFQSLPRGTLDAVAAVVRGSRCFRLDVNELDIACRLVTDLLESATHP